MHLKQFVILMSVGLITIILRLPGCRSLKEKRSRLKPLLIRLRKEFNISVAEIDNLDVWQRATLGTTMISNNRRHVERELQKMIHFIESSNFSMYFLYYVFSLVFNPCA